MFTLEAKSEKSLSGVDTPCRWEPRSRLISFGTGSVEYTATLSPDGRSMTDGKWSEYEMDYGSSKKSLKKTGVWSAKLEEPDGFD